jgi:uncharacterized membrane protein YgcG
MLKLLAFLALLAVAIGIYARIKGIRRQRQLEEERSFAEQKEWDDFIASLKLPEPITFTPEPVVLTPPVRSQPRRADGKFASYAEYTPPIITPPGVPSIPAYSPPDWLSNTPNRVESGGIVNTDSSQSYATSDTFSGGGGGDFSGGGSSGDW